MPTTYLKLRNNSQRVRVFPPLVDSGRKLTSTIEGASKPIVIRPGQTITITEERLRAYKSAALDAALTEKGDGRYADLQILGATTEAIPELPPSAPDPEQLAAYKQREGKNAPKDDGVSVADSKGKSTPVDLGTQPDANAVNASTSSTLDSVIAAAPVAPPVNAAPVATPGAVLPSPSEVLGS